MTGTTTSKLLFYDISSNELQSSSDLLNYAGNLTVSKPLIISNDFAVIGNCSVYGQSLVSGNLTINRRISTAASQGIGIGYGAGVDSSNNSIAIGYMCGNDTQKAYCIAIGNEAGRFYQSNNCIAIGESAGNTGQNTFAISIGNFAGSNTQGSGGIAIGRRTGRYSQGADAIALGSLAGETNQHANSIIINATGGTLASSSSSALFVAPIRDSSVPLISGSTVSAYPLFYNFTTKEVLSRSTAGSFMLRTNTTSQTIANTVQTIVLFPTLSTRSIGVIDASFNYNAGTFTNQSTSTLLLSINAGWAYNGATGNNQHSALGRFGIRGTISTNSDYNSNSLSCSFSLLPNESFYCVALQNSGVDLGIGSVPSSYPTLITINLLN